MRETLLLVPDIGDFDVVPVIEILVQSGQQIAVDESLIVLESDKATMEVPSTAAGVVGEILLQIGDTVSAGSPILRLAASDPEPAAQERNTGASQETTAAQSAPDTSRTDKPSPAPTAPTTPPAPAETTATEGHPALSSHHMAPEQMPRMAPSNAAFERPILPHASPSVRRFARQLGVDLGTLTGSGRKGRILHEDVERFVKKRLQQPPQTTAMTGLPDMPEIDFSRFGATEQQPLSRINKISAAVLHRNWLRIPHVTQFDEADITELEAFRKQLQEGRQTASPKITLLSFLMKALVAALREFPRFNSSLAADGETLISKHYFHIGIAVETPQGLVVPVIRDVDRKDLRQLASELASVSERARQQKLSREDMQGGCMTISSLGGIGGTAFTPIINAPEAAILGVSRAAIKAVYDPPSKTFRPRLMLPLSLSYDHRIIDGAAGARFTQQINMLLCDIRRLLL